jgi:hypothetical protein
LLHRTKEGARKRAIEGGCVVQLTTIEVLDGEKNTTRYATNARMSQAMKVRTIE